MNRSSLQLTDAFDRWAFTEFAVPVRSLAVYRILYASLLLVMAVPRGLWLSSVPDAFFHAPFGLSMFWTTIPGSALMHTLNLALIVALVALLIGWHTRTASFSVTILFIVLHSFLHSLGKINHGSLLVSITPAVMACSGWGQQFSVDARGSAEDVPDRHSGAWCLALLACLTGVAMFTAGWPKLLSGWLDLSSQASYGHFMRNFHVAGRQTWAGKRAIQLFPAGVWEFKDWATVLMECGFLVAVVNLRLFRVFCAIASLFHLGVLLVFSITFWGNPIAYAAFIDWNRLPVPFRVEAFLQKAGAVLARIPPQLLLTLITVAVIVPGFTGQQSIANLCRVEAGQVVVITAAAVTICYLSRSLWLLASARSGGWSAVGVNPVRLTGR